MAKQHIRHGGRGAGRPQDKFQYGKRLCQYVADFKTRQEADRLANKFERDGILAVVKKWYGRWVVYRCGVRKRRRNV